MPTSTAARKKPAANPRKAKHTYMVELAAGESVVTYQPGNPEAMKKAFARIVRSMRQRKPRADATTASQLLSESRNRFASAG